MLTVVSGRSDVPNHVRSLLRSDLVEVARLGLVDKVAYRDSPSGEERTFIFKYSPLTQDDFFWSELQVNMRLPAHPHIVPLDRLVLDEIDGTEIVGFTMPFIPGGDVGSTRTSRPFKLEWLKQLMGVVDDLNLQFGIEHRDVAPRNLLVDPVTDNILLFDFGCAAWIGVNKPGHNRQGAWGDGGSDDIDGVVMTVYEIITNSVNCIQRRRDRDLVWNPLKSILCEARRLGQAPGRQAGARRIRLLRHARSLGAKALGFTVRTFHASAFVKSDHSRCTRPHLASIPCHPGELHNSRTLTTRYF